MFAGDGSHVSLHEQSDIQLRIDDVVDDTGQVIPEIPDLPTPGRSSNDMTIDTNIAPFLVDEPPSPATTYNYQPSLSLPSTSSKGGFAKSSLSSFLSFRGSGLTSNTSLLRSTRGSGSGSTSHLSLAESKRRSSDDADSVRTATYYPPNPSTSPQHSSHHELRKRPSKFNLGLLKRRGSKAHLHQDSRDEASSPPPPLPTNINHNNVYNNPVEPPHPLAYLAVGPPVPPKDKSKEKDKKKRGKGKRNGPPEVPPKDDTSLYPLDTNLESMEGIIDVSRVAHDQLNPNSPGSGSASFSGSGGHQHHSHSQPHLLQPTGSSSALSSPPTFSDPFSSSTDVIPTSAFGPTRVSPTTVVPHVNGTGPVNGFSIASPSTSAPPAAGGGQDDPDAPRADDGTWKAPESWAVIDEHGLQNGKLDMTAPEDSDSEDDGGAARARRGGGASVVDLRTMAAGGVNGHHGPLHPPSIHVAESIKPSRKGKERAMPDDSELTVRIYRPNGFYHSAAVGVSLTVYDLLPALHRRTLSNDKQTSRLFLKERGKERILDVRELPLHIIYRRMAEAGYTWNDGLILLGGEHLSFLLKFIYRDPDLGIGMGRPSFSEPPTHHSSFAEPSNNELRLETFDYVDLAGRSLRAIPVVLHQHADQIISLKLSRNPMIDLPLDFIEACTALRDLRLSNMSMRKVPANLTAAKWLQRLDLSSNYIKVRELEGGRLHKIPELLSLFLQNNLLKDLPSTFANLETLTTLNISNNRLRSIPEVVTKIKTLRDLDVSFNYLESLPENIGDLFQLDRFLFLGNSVPQIPDSFYKLRHLEYVDCRRNQIVDLTIVMNLPRIKILYADHNAIHLLDLSMGRNINIVDVSHNEITQVVVSLPPFGSASRLLTSLDLSHASLTTLDAGVLDKLVTLKILKLQHNSLSYIPDTLGELVELEELYCFENRLIKLPETIGKLKKLKVLDAHGNNLREVPGTIWDCGCLERLNLSTNFVTTFPPPTIIPMHGQQVLQQDGAMKGGEVPEDYNPMHVILGHLYPPLSFSLIALYLSENRISSYPPDSPGNLGLRNMAFLRSLHSLNLSYNEITDFPPGFFRNLAPKLREVYLCGNGITSLQSDDFVRMRELRVVYLSGNKLTVLPAELTRLEQLRVIDVSNNNLRYNINNYEFDWNWNYNENIRYLNLSGNKRLQIKPDNRHIGTSRSSRESHHPGSLSGFASLRHLRNLGLMDLTVTASDLPDETEDRRIRSTASVVGGLGYGISDCLGREGALTMLDLVHEFPPSPSSSSSNSNGGHRPNSRALFAMFGNVSPPKALRPGISPNRHAKFLHDHFLGFFQGQMQNKDMQDGKHLAVDVLRRSFLGLHQEIHNQLFVPGARKGSVATVATVHGHVTVGSGTGGQGSAFPGDRKLFAANVGSSLGIISRKGQPFELSKKHCPWNPDELRRIRKSEGWVSPSGLVNDEVDVTRSFGYYHLLPVVNASPDMCEYDISDTDEFLIMGNRGLWDYVSFQTAVDVASTTNEPALVAQKLRDFAMSYGSTGNIMVMAIRLRDVHDRSALVRSSTILEPGLMPPSQPSVVSTKGHSNMVVDKSVRHSSPEVAPPTGHIALVFTDIRNSTHLWEVNPGMPAAIQLHNDLMRRRLRDCGGYEFKTEGDAFLCSFPTVMAAVWFCLSVQVQLLQEHWPKEILECEDGQPIKDPGGNLIAQGVSVRMGIHCGTPLCVQDPVTHRMDYLGPVTNRAARVSGLAQGGQIMCSAEVIREINASVLGAMERTELSKFQPLKAVDAVKQLGVVIKDVGERKLKGLEVPEFVSAIYPSGLEARHDLGSEEVTPASVILNVAHVREMGMLCLRLEALSSGRIFTPSLMLSRDTDLGMTFGEGEGEEEDQQQQQQQFVESWNEMWRELHVDPENVLPPMTTRWTDHDLLMTLDSFTVRIQNALQSIVKRFMADSIDAPNVLAVLEDAGMDESALALIGELLGYS
ncbi:hypothetical protein D9756_010796 [Leucocoprinus leucothites]|uniref:Adenylate cyclase n=1 Tax=Leucocoprinus leucothites TaxID=201217 RepID=A0A8H5CUB7_9AGAR|nr:hypothetical protein D9756_010796 [Leucoagaricus leucothites]